MDDGVTTAPTPSRVPSRGTVTILVPTFNRREKLRRAIDSITAQTYTDLRIIVCDNTSGDGTPELVGDLRARDDRIRYFRHDTNIGMVPNFNFALSKVDTPFFGFLSDDDYYLPNFVSDAMRAFDRFPDIGLSILSAPTITEQGHVIGDQLDAWPREGHYTPRESVPVAAPGNHPILTACIYRSTLVSECLFDESIASIADYPVLLNLLARHNIHVSKKRGLFFVRHPGAEGLKRSSDLDYLVRAYGVIANKFRQPPQVDDVLKEALLGGVSHLRGMAYLQHVTQSLRARDLERALLLHHQLTQEGPRDLARLSSVLLGIYRLGGPRPVGAILGLRAATRSLLSRVKSLRHRR